MVRLGLVAVLFGVAFIFCTSSVQGQHQPQAGDTVDTGVAGVLRQCFETNTALHRKIEDLQMKICAQEKQQIRQASCEVDRMTEAPTTEATVTTEATGTTEATVTTASPLLGTEANPALSCLDIKNARSDAMSGTYFLRLGGATSRVYCHFDTLDRCGSGGWTTVMKVDGDKNTFKYFSTYWTNENSYNEAAGSTGLDLSETKLKTYSELPFTKLCLVFRRKTTSRRGYVLIQRSTPQTLFSLLRDNRYRPIQSLGRNYWLSAITVDSPTVQPSCNKEGFNLIPDDPAHVQGLAKARIGILFNNENECGSPDISFGVGLAAGRMHNIHGNMVYVFAQ